MLSCVTKLLTPVSLHGVTTHETVSWKAYYTFVFYVLVYITD